MDSVQSYHTYVFVVTVLQIFTCWNVPTSHKYRACWCHLLCMLAKLSC